MKKAPDAALALVQLVSPFLREKTFDGHCFTIWQTL